MNIADNNVTLLYVRDDDAIYESVSGDENLRSEVSCVHINEIMKYIEPIAWPTVLQYDFPEELVEKFRGRVVINRMFSFDGTAAQKAVRKWGYHDAWFHFAVDALLSKAASLIHDTGYRGVARCVLPLNHQWLKIKAQLPEIQVPNFDYAFGGEPPEIEGFHDPLQKSIWSIFDWKIETKLSQREANWHKFVVDRPTGTPVIAYFLCDEILEYIFPRERCALDEALVRRVVTTCRQLFKSEIGEVLFYIPAPDQLIFASFSPIMKSAALSPEWTSNFAAWLESISAHEVA